MDILVKIVMSLKIFCRGKYTATGYYVMDRFFVTVADSACFVNLLVEYASLDVSGGDGLFLDSTYCRLCRLLECGRSHPIKAGCFVDMWLVE